MTTPVQDDKTNTATPNRIAEGSSPTTIPFWGDDPEAWDTVIIKRKKLPGVCELKGRGFAQRLDRKKSAGRNGHTVTHMGIECAEIEIEITLWTEEHLKTFAELIPTLKPRAKTSKTVERYQLADASTGRQFRNASTGHAGEASFKALSDSLKAKQKVTTTDGGPQPVSIYHPALALFKIRSVVILSCSFPEKQSSTDVYTVKMKCEEFMSGAARSGVVSTATKSLDITTLGAGAIANKLKRPTPADNNTGP